MGRVLRYVIEHDPLSPDEIEGPGDVKGWEPWVVREKVAGDVVGRFGAKREAQRFIREQPNRYLDPGEEVAPEWAPRRRKP